MAARDDARLSSLAEMARALGQSQPLFTLLEVAAEEARRALSASSVSVSRLVLGSTTIRTLLNVGELGPSEQRWPEDETYDMSVYANLAQVLEDLRTWTVSIDDAAASRAELDLLRDLQKGSSLGSPIIVDGQLWGEFYATRQLGEPRFDRDDIAYTEALVAILSGSISRSLREESLERLAYQDPLTGLANRRALDEHARQAFVVTPGTSRVVTAVQVDINRLKLVNNTLGHDAGDQLIQSVARALRAEFNHLPRSLVARIGGDEFSVLVVGHELPTVAAITDGLCQRTWPYGGRPGLSCGAAAAVVTAESTVTPGELFAAADRAQYAAKRQELSATITIDDVGVFDDIGDTPALPREAT